MEINNKNVLVIGAARSGLEATRFLLAKGANVTLNDSNQHVQIPQDLLHAKNLQIITGAEPDVQSISPDFIVVSPAVPLDKPFMIQAFESGIDILGEMELSYRFAKAPFVGITGTNGKTTTTSLTGELFSMGGYQTLIGGNIGNPLINEVENTTKEGVIVAEISSFQLETISEFRPRVAVITNLTPDHLDRHKTMDMYLEAKARIFENQTEEDWLILNYDDPVIKELAARSKGKVLFFSRKEQVPQGAYVKDGFLTIRCHGYEESVIKPEEIFIKGGHNLENAMAGALAAAAMNISVATIADGLRSFKGVEHRLEFSGLFRGVTYVNDSKGTNPDASLKALDAYDNPIIIIAGGRNKGNSFDQFAKVISQKCRFAVLIGESKEEIQSELDKQKWQHYHLTNNYEEAVKTAVAKAEPGDVVMLSPACASWDMFDNYETRGNQFKELVKKYNLE